MNHSSKEAEHFFRTWIEGRGYVASRPLPPGALYLGIKRFIEDVGGDRDQLVGRSKTESLTAHHLMLWLSLRNLTIPTVFVGTLYDLIVRGVSGKPFFMLALHHAKEFSWNEGDRNAYAKS